MVVYLIIGILLAVLLFMLLNWWANAEVGSAKRSLVWAIVAVCLLLALLLIGTGKAVAAILPAGYAALRMFGPSLAKWFVANRLFGRQGAQQGSTAGTDSMTRDEALEVLGLEDGASERDINDAYRRLMSQVHPDKGGSDWMAAKLNAARKTLTGK